MSDSGNMKLFYSRSDPDKDETPDQAREFPECHDAKDIREFIDSVMEVDNRRSADNEYRIIELSIYCETMVKILTYSIATTCFLIFQTSDGYWWSLDKKSAGFYIQRGVSKRTVLESFSKKARMTPVERLDHVEKVRDKTIFDLLEILKQEECQSYDIFYRNCKHLSKLVFEKLTGRVPDVHPTSDAILRMPRIASIAKFFQPSWRSVLTFDSNTGSMNPNTRKEFTSDQILSLLKGQLQGSLGTTSKIDIEYVSIYTHPLEALHQLSPFTWFTKSRHGQQYTMVDYHAYVVFNTSDGFWWSLEKHTRGIFLRKSDDRDDVISNFQGTSRITPVILEIEDDGNQNLSWLLELLANENLTQEYRLFYGNCQDFAKIIFDKMAKTKVWKFMNPVEYFILWFPIYLCRRLCNPVWENKSALLVTISVPFIAQYFINW